MSDLPDYDDTDTVLCDFPDYVDAETVLCDLPDSINFREQTRTVTDPISRGSNSHQLDRLLTPVSNQ